MNIKNLVWEEPVENVTDIYYNAKSFFNYKLYNGKFENWDYQIIYSKRYETYIIFIIGYVVGNSKFDNIKTLIDAKLFVDNHHKEFIKNTLDKLNQFII